MRLAFRFSMAACLLLLLCGCQPVQSTAKSQLESELSRRHVDRVQSMRHYDAGVALHESGDLDGAERELSKAASVDASHAAAWLALGAVQFDQGHVAEAAQSFNEVTRLAPARYEAWFNIGAINESVGRYERAIEAYETALGLAPDQVEVMENLARCLIETKQRPERARQLIERALVVEHRPQWRLWLREQIELLSAREQPGN